MNLYLCASVCVCVGAYVGGRGVWLSVGDVRNEEEEHMVPNNFHNKDSTFLQFNLIT